MTGSRLRTFGNGESVGLAEIPAVGFGAFKRTVCARGGRLAAMFGLPMGSGRVRLYALVAREGDGWIGAVSTDVGDHYPSLTPDFPQAHLFEREIFEQTGVRPAGHPWLKPVRTPSGSAGLADFFQVRGEEIHEVAVGPVHAGVIEPGHFRFQCHGENVLHLEISLGYQHRGVERAMVGGPDRRTIHLMETVAGDTTVGHATAYGEVIESLSRCAVPGRAQALRGIALELERIANHTGDLGAMANDVGYLPTASYCGRLRGDFLNMTALLCGSRFGRSLIRPGGVVFDVDDDRISMLLQQLDRAVRDLAEAVRLLWDSPSVMSRFEETGVVSQETCLDLGMVGVAARACGLERDVRLSFPSGIYRFKQVPVSTVASGDVYARATVRWLEIQRSATFIKEQLNALPAGPVCRPPGRSAPDAMAVALVEGWRGEICHAAMTDSEGRFSMYKIVDPSFHNWTGLAMALRGEQISDFPLCNKSFNLSYCGHDL